MKKYLIFFFLVFFYATFGIAQKKVAVYVTGEQEEGVKKVLGSKMVTYVTESDDFTAVERTADFLSALSEEHDYQLSGEVSISQIVKLGKQFASQYVAVVDVTELYGELFVASRLIDVQTSQVISSFEATGQSGSLSNLTNLANKIADGLILAPERKRIEKTREAHDQEQAMLRQRAKANLLPPDAVEYGNYIVINRKVPIEITFDESSNTMNWRVKGDIPKGFQVANDGVIEFLWNNYPAFKDTFDDGRYVYDPYIKKKYEKRGKKNEKREFYVLCSTLYRTWIRRDWWYIGCSTKTKLGLEENIEASSYPLSVILYREKLTESEIQTEINRMSR